MLKQTSAPIATGSCESINPEFVRLPELQRLFGIRRSYAYSLIREGKVRSFCLRKRGARTGVRLVSVDSVRAFFKAQLEGGSQ